MEEDALLSPLPPSVSGQAVLNLPEATLGETMPPGAQDVAALESR